jgi:hypothetical protein
MNPRVAAPVAAALLVLVGACSSDSDAPESTATTTISVATTTTEPVASTTVKPAPPAGVRWDLAADFRRRPADNPLSHVVGGPRVWSLRRGASLDRTGSYPLLAKYTRAFARGLAAWHGASGACGGLPAIGVTASRSAELCNALVPEQSVVVSPDRDQLAVVGWESPVTGNVEVAVGFGDLDADCGGSIPYWVDLGTAPLAAGEVVPGGSKSLPSLPTPVIEGQSIYFIVGPSADARPGCDATQLHVTIATAPPS